MFFCLDKELMFSVRHYLLKLPHTVELRVCLNSQLDLVDTTYYIAKTVQENSCTLSIGIS